eukprot:TRINITY_DN18926_c0_g1_i1.p4 TRINITY_DN18926_c0_g1~~TRINITY_DN18926_c0_g1_i1.p4  ORF type:complete len:121 (-),score=20.35 TRINITY_DN18926_c0_g1_i1:743-1105(-)
MPEGSWALAVLFVVPQPGLFQAFVSCRGVQGGGAGNGRGTVRCRGGEEGDVWRRRASCRQLSMPHATPAALVAVLSGEAAPMETQREKILPSPPELSIVIPNRCRFCRALPASGPSDSGE